MRSGLGIDAEVLGDVFKCFLFVELAGDDQHGVVGLVELLVEGPQVVDRHALDVGAVADGRLAVVVPFVGDGRHPLRQHALGRVLARLELVADHGELGREVFGLDRAVDHAVGLELDGELEVLVAGRQGLEVVGPIDPGRAVELGPALLHGPGDVGVGGRPLEDHVLQQVGHAGLAVALVPRADQDRQVDGDLGAGRIGEQEHAQAVIQPVLGDPLDRGDLSRSGRSGVRARR